MTLSLNTSMEMHDAFVLELTTAADGTGFVLFHGCVYRSTGEPGRDAGTSGWQNVRMTFTGMTFEGLACEHKSYVSDGSLSVNGTLEDGMIAFPAEHSGTICLSMTVSDDFSVRNIRATSAVIHCEGEFEPEADGTMREIITRLSDRR